MAYVEKEGIVTKICVVLAITTVIRANNSTTVRPQTQHNLQGIRQENCSYIQFPNGSNSYCYFKDHCMRAECSLRESGPLSIIGLLTIQLHMYGCCQLMRAEVEFFWKTSGYGKRTQMLVRIPPGDRRIINFKEICQVELQKNDSKVHFKFIEVSKTSSKFATLVEGDLLAPSKCGVKEGVNDVDFLPGLDKIARKCVYSHNCSKLECVTNFTHLRKIKITVRFEVNRCNHSLAGKVAIQLPGLDWSSTIGDDKKVILPVTKYTLSTLGLQLPIYVKPCFFVKVRLQETKGNFANFKVMIDGQFSVTILQGRQLISSDVCAYEGESVYSKQCPADERGSDHSKQCPDVSFFPKFNGVPSKCVYSDDCSRVECVAEADPRKFTVGFEAHRCKQALTANITIQRRDDYRGGYDLDWSHTLGDGEKATLPAPPMSRFFYNGILLDDDASLFIKVKLQEMQGNNVNFTVSIVASQPSMSYPVNFVLLQGELPITTDDCGSWFSRQSNGVKAAVVVVPIIVIVISLAAFCFYKRRRDGTRFMVDIFPGRNKHEMQRQYEEL